MSRNSGYTLIEIMVGLTIIGLIFATGYAAFREFARRQTITSAIRIMIGDLRLAQSESLAGKKPDVPVCFSPSTLEGYQFGVVTPRSYYVEVKCSGGVYRIKDVELAEAITLTVPSINPILFKVLGKGTNIPTATGSTVISLSAFGTTSAVTVTTGGSIE